MASPFVPPARRRRQAAPAPAPAPAACLPAVTAARRRRTAKPTPVVLPPDLVAACLVQLRAASGGAVALAFGDGAATPKLFSDEAQGQPALPYLVFGEPGEQEEAESADSDGLVHRDARGTLQCDVFAAGKVQARTLRRQVVAALTDAALANADCAVLYFRPENPNRFPPVPDVAADAAQCYRAGVVFRYIVDRTYP